MRDHHPIIWVDADSCPVPARDVIIKAANRTGVTAIFVANTPLPIKTSPAVVFRQVESGFDQADRYISDRVEKNHFVITADIHLADLALKKQAVVVSARGERFSADTIAQKLNMRDFVETMRDTLVASGQQRGGNLPFSAKDKQRFANAINAWLTKLK